MKQFYVYGHYKPNEITPFYIGKGSGNRAYQTINRNKHWHNVVNKHGFRVEIMFDELTEELAYCMERDFIKMFGRADLGCGNLVNWSDGGEGIHHTVETRRKISEANRKRVYSDETKMKISRSGSKHSEETKKRMSETRKGQKAWNKGIPVTDEVKEKISKSLKGQKAWNKGIPHTEESRKKMRESAKRRPPITEETRKRKSDVQKRRYEK
jgi:hypothetical protein